MIAAVFLMAGCAGVSFIINRGASCEDMAGKNGFTKEIIKTDAFTLLAYTRFREEGGPVNIYIEAFDSFSGSLSAYIYIYKLLYGYIFNV